MTADSHWSVGLNDVVHQRVRLGILAILGEARSADFQYCVQVSNSPRVTCRATSARLRALGMCESTKATTGVARGRGST